MISAFGVSHTDNEGFEGHERRNRYNREFLQKLDIQVHPGKVMSVFDYFTAMDYDPGLLNKIPQDDASLSRNVFFINLGNKTSSHKTTWSIRRRFVDFVNLDKDLTEELIEKKMMKRSQVPEFKNFYSSRVEAQESFLQAAENYLKKLLDSPEVRLRSTVIYEFLELSQLVFPEFVPKLKEGYLKKKGGGRFKRNKSKLYFRPLFSSWKQRWFILTENGFLYTSNSSSTKVREMLFFDQSFQIDYDRRASGKQVEISLVTQNRRLNLQAKDLFEALDWVGELKKVVKYSPYTKNCRFLSFAPITRPTNFCKWFVDGNEYFEELYEALTHAKKEIFITDWWLSPELTLRRPVEKGSTEYRLDHVLGRIATRGVKIYVLIYHEVRAIMYNDSEHAKEVLHKMSPNIFVLKHPSEPFFPWSHHEKLVVIDQTTGFLGGLDLCFGRSDTSDHPINDPALVKGNGETFPGQDYCNPRRADFRGVRKFHKPLVDKGTVPRMPFHDAMMKVIGPVVTDMCQHFFQYWNHVRIDSYGKEAELPLPSPLQFHFKKDQINNISRSNPTQVITEEELGLSLIPCVQFSPTFGNSEGIDVEADSVVNKASSQYKDGYETVWPKISKRREGEAEGDKSIRSSKLEMRAQRIEEKKNLDIKLESKKLPNSKVHCNIVDELEMNEYQTQTFTWNVEEKELLENSCRKETRGTSSTKFRSSVEEFTSSEFLVKPSLQRSPNFQVQPEGSCSCQMIRSASKWSLGLNTDNNRFENSIQNAYIELIQNSKSFIYIENQFFLSGTAGKAIKNRVGQALVYRIETAHAKHERFRVLVFLPLLPAFEGEITESKAALVRIQLHWQYRTICRGGQSIFEQLKRKGIRPEDYIQFYSLRTHGRMMNGEPVSEMIYIHSKILIVDDNVALIGSANINDRSLEGSRDSELAIVVEDSNKIVSFMDGQRVQVGHFACSLRKRLLAEHLGLEEEKMVDPLSSEFTNSLNMIAERNTQIYRDIFACYPDNHQKTLKDVLRMSHMKNLKKYEELASQIQGKVVLYPLEFLSEENLAASFDTKEYYVPNKIFA